MWWVVPLIIGAVFWAGADTISDAVITDHTAPSKVSDHSDVEEGKDYPGNTKQFHATIF